MGDGACGDIEMLPGDEEAVGDILDAMSAFPVSDQQLVREGATSRSRVSDEEEARLVAGSFREMSSGLLWSSMLEGLLVRSVVTGRRELSRTLVQAGSLFGDALHVAIKASCVDVVRDLVRRGAPVNARHSTGGNTPLQVAARYGEECAVAVIPLLLENGARVGDAATSWTPFEWALRCGSIGAMRALLEAGANTHECSRSKLSMIHVAVQSQNSAKLRFMIAAGAKVNATTDKGWTSLHFAATVGGALMVDILVDGGAGIEARNVNGLTPLGMTAACLNPRAASALLRHGAEVSTRDGCLKTPMQHVAVRAGEMGSAEMADLLLRSGGDETTVSAEIVGKLGLHLSKTQTFEMVEEFGKVCTLLANAPADRAWRRRGPMVLHHSRFLADSSVRVKMREAALHWTAQDAEWVGVMVWLVGATEDIFREILGFM